MTRFLTALALCAPVLALPSMASAQSQCPDDFVSFRGSEQAIACVCSADATGLGHVYGMDIYTDDSSVCRAALHAGMVGPKGGGINVFPLPGRESYPGVTRNGVTSYNWARHDGSFSFAVGQAAPAQPVVVQPAPVVVQHPAPVVVQPAPVIVQPATPASATVPTAGATGLAAMCPDDFVSYRETAQPLTCGCPVSNLDIGHVYGMDIYTDDSGVCKAAVHAGVVSAKGGNVTLMPQPGREMYPGVTRNGVTSYNWGKADGSFQFAAAALPAPAAPVPVKAEPPATASPCPDDFVAFNETTAPLACGCSEEATERGFAYGMDIYTSDSGICKAAVHAGYISTKGGDVTVVPQPGQPSYAGVTRNGVTSYNFGGYGASFSFHGPMTQPASVAAAPQQQPIGATLAATGQVQLYIHFAFNSDALEQGATPILEELLAVLRADPSLNLSLIGHTDSVGSADYNLALSAKRAESVKLWLIRNGVLPSRLQASGRGMSEPIDTNQTEYGRAVNRRVQAMRM